MAFVDVGGVSVPSHLVDNYLANTGQSDGSMYVGDSSSGSGSSARSVASSSGLSGGSSASMANQLTAAMDQIYQITERNTARSEAQAAQLRDWQERQNQIAMDFNSAEAAKNRDWQKMMSDTAHQREIADLQAAGLNPVLSAMNGNGAAVTSGATASGVTSSGAKGEVDTSADMALVNLLGTMWSAQTQIEMQRASAENNLAIADKNAAASQAVAEIYTAQSREASQLAAETSLKQSEISAAVSELVSRVSAETSRYTASLSAGASNYATEMAHQNALLYTEAEKIVAGMNVDASKRNTLVNGLVDLAQSGISFVDSQLNSKRAASSAMDVAKENHVNSYSGFAYQSGRAWQDFFSSLGSKITGTLGKLYSWNR